MNVAASLTQASLTPFAGDETRADLVDWAHSTLAFFQKHNRGRAVCILLMPPDMRGHFDTWLQKNLSRHFQEMSSDTYTYKGIAYHPTGFFIPGFYGRDAAETFLKDMKTIARVASDATIHLALLESKAGKKPMRANVKHPTSVPKIV